MASEEPAEGAERMTVQPLPVTHCASDRSAHQPQHVRSQDVSKEQQAVSQAFIEPDSGRVLKILTDGSILILQGWKKPIETSGNTLTVPAFTNVQAFPNATEPASLAATDQGQQFLEDSMEALRYHERRGSSQHVPELLPRAHSAPATVAQVKNAGDGLEKDRSKNLASAKKEVSEAVAALQAAADGVTDTMDANSPKPAAVVNDQADQAAGELLMNFANSAAMSSATQAGAALDPTALLTSNKLCSSDQDTPGTRDLSTHGAKLLARRASLEDATANRQRQPSETQIALPVVSQDTGNQAPESETCRYNVQIGGGASQTAISTIQSASAQYPGGGAGAKSDKEEARVREIAADMLVGSLVTTIAQQSPAAELPGDDAMMSCMLSFAKACIGSSAPTDAELRAALERCKQRARAMLQPSQKLTAGAAARAVSSVTSTAAKKRAGLPDLADAPPATSSCNPPNSLTGTGGAPAATPSTGGAATINTSTAVSVAASLGNLAATAPAAAAAAALSGQKRPSTPNFVQHSRPKAVCTAPPLTPSKLTQNLETPPTSNPPAASSSQEIFSFLQALMARNPDPASMNLVLQALNQENPAAVKEAAAQAQAVTDLAAQLRQSQTQSQSQSEVSQAATRQALLQQLLQANPGTLGGLIAPEGPSTDSAPNRVSSGPLGGLVPAVYTPDTLGTGVGGAGVRGLTPAVATTSTSAINTGNTQPGNTPLSSPSTKEFAAIVNELQQHGASDQTIMHVLQTLMQQQGNPQNPQNLANLQNPIAAVAAAAAAAPSQRQPVGPPTQPPITPPLAQALGLTPAVASGGVTLNPSLLMTAAYKQPTTVAGDDISHAALLAAATSHAVSSHNQPQSITSQLPIVSVGAKGSGVRISGLSGISLATDTDVNAKMGDAGGMQAAAHSQLAKILSGLESAQAGRSQSGGTGTS